MVPGYDVLDPLPDEREALPGLSVVSDHVAEADPEVHAAAVDVVQDGLEGSEVGVDRQSSSSREVNVVRGASMA